jgi:hypothetical protein
MVILSCGHREDDFDKHYTVSLKEWTIGEDGWQKAISYQSICFDCYRKYTEEGLILENDEKAQEWLLNDKEN